MDDATNIARVTERLLRDGATLRVNERLELGGKRKFYDMKNNMENKDNFFVKRKKNELFKIVRTNFIQNDRCFSEGTNFPKDFERTNDYVEQTF